MAEWIDINILLMLVFSLADISFSVFDSWVFHVALSISTMAVGYIYIYIFLDNISRSEESEHIPSVRAESARIRGGRVKTSC
jgi:hypothetical protein